MKVKRTGALLSMVAMLASCGGGGGGSTGGGVISGGTPTPPPPPTSSGCSLRERQDWVLAQMREWYLYPETLPSNTDPSPYTTVQAYIDALTATARAQSRDRYFTYITSIAEENAFYNSGSSAGFGFRLSYDTAARRVFVAESFEGTAALAAGIDRGTEIIAIGTNASNLRTVSDILASEGTAGITSALGPSTAGTTRVVRVTDSTGTRTVTMSKSDYELTPVSSRYGAKIIDDGGKKVGYVNLRTYISTADSSLRNAFASFKAQGVTELIVDLRYNGGGLVSIAELMGDLMGANRTTSQVFDYTVFRAEKSSNNSTKYFAPQTQSIAPTKIAFIGTGGTASASELTINGMLPYLHANMALVGSNTYGKPVGQIAIDKSACDDRLRVIAFATQNADRQGGYYTGLAGTVDKSCAAGDDLTHPFGDPQEASIKAALDFLGGRSCTAIASGGQSAQSLRTSSAKELLIPDLSTATTAQREVPGSF